MICLMSSPEERAQDIFGRRASFYTTSASHAEPQVLAKVLALADPKPDWTVLDVATGTGHTAFALSRHVASVIVRPKRPCTPQDTGLFRRLRCEKVALRATGSTRSLRKSRGQRSAVSLAISIQLLNHLALPSCVQLMDS